MAGKKKAKKASPNAATKEPSPSPKITLPAFGLADEILGTTGHESATRDEGRGPGDRERTDGVEAPEGTAVASSQPETKDEPNGAELHLVTFHLDREQYGVDIGSVQEIIRVGTITAVPNTPPFVKGVINLRGKVIPVLDLRRRLLLPEATLTKKSRIMVVEAAGKTLGVLVDEVSQVMKLPGAAVESPPDDVDANRAFVRGIGKLDSRLVMLMDLGKVLAKEGKSLEGPQRSANDRN